MCGVHSYQLLDKCQEYYSIICSLQHGDIILAELSAPDANNVTVETSPFPPLRSAVSTNYYFLTLSDPHVAFSFALTEIK